MVKEVKPFVGGFLEDSLQIFRLKRLLEEGGRRGGKE